MKYFFILSCFFLVVSAKAQNSSAAPANNNTVVRIRCAPDQSLSAALIVVDGVVKEQSALKEINPNDIKSIDVLKGKSASALYGSKGVNGVIIIKTKACKEQPQNSLL